MKTGIFEIFWKFWNLRKFLIFWIFLKISEFSLIDDEGQVFRINIKLLSNPVAELKIREKNSHCRSIVLKTMDCSIVKQLEKEKNSYFNVENFVVMFIYWGTIILSNIPVSSLIRGAPSSVVLNFWILSVRYSKMIKSCDAKLSYDLPCAWINPVFRKNVTL